MPPNQCRWLTQTFTHLLQEEKDRHEKSQFFEASYYQLQDKLSISSTYINRLDHPFVLFRETTKKMQQSNVYYIESCLHHVFLKLSKFHMTKGVNSNLYIYIYIFFIHVLCYTFFQLICYRKVECQQVRLLFTIERQQQTNKLSK